MNVVSAESPDVHSSSEEYAKRFSGEVGEFFLKRQEMSVLELLSEISGKKGLDVGGGHAQIAPVLINHGYDLTVLGSNQSCAARLSSLLALGKLRFKVGSLSPIPYGDNSFDLVISLRIISHSPDWRNFVSELCRVAKDGVIIDYPPRFSFNLLTPWLFRIKKRIEGNTRGYTIFTHSEMVNEFKKQGFVLRRRINQFFLPMGIHRLMKNVGISSFLEKLASIFGLTSIFGAPSVAMFVRA